MAVVINAKGTSIGSFQIGKQGPLVKNNAGTIEFRNSSDSGFVDITANNLDVVDDTTPQLGGQLDVNGFGIGDGTLELLKFIETGSAVNEITITNAATGNNPRITASGDNAAVGLDIRSKGASAINFDTASGSNRQVQVKNTASAVNYITLTGSATGDDVTIGAAGTDTNINIQINSKGVGQVVLGTTGIAAGLSTSDGTVTGSDDGSEDGEDLAISAGDGVEDGAFDGDGGSITITPGTGVGVGVDGTVCIRDDDSVNVMCFEGVDAAVNYLTITNAATGNDVTIGATGTDTNVDIKISPNGTGEILLDGGTVVGVPTGGNKGSGSLNAEALYIGGDLLTSVVSTFDSDTFTGDGSTTGFTLSRAAVSEDAILVAVSGLVQDGGVDYTVSGTTLTFTTAPPNTVKILVLFQDAKATINETTTTKTGAYTTIAADDVVFADSTSSSFTITLGTAAVISGNHTTIKDSGGNGTANNIIIDTEGSETIDGAASVTISSDFEVFTFTSDGTNWFIT